MEGSAAAEPAGTALSTEPGAGTLLEPESTVTIYYSGGPPEPAPPEPAPPEPAPAAPDVLVPDVDDLIPGGEAPQEPRGGDAGNRDKGNGDGGGGGGDGGGGGGDGGGGRNN